MFWSIICLHKLTLSVYPHGLSKNPPKNYSVNFPILNLQDDQGFIKKSLEDSEQVQVNNHNTNAWQWYMLKFEVQYMLKLIVLFLLHIMVSQPPYVFKKRKNIVLSTWLTMISILFWLSSYQMYFWSAYGRNSVLGRRQWHHVLYGAYC